ncbi:MAG: amidohydrolase [Lachnospiraceae bacterium]|nr:amidohydrolase [Lachnospiraceae bacterium]MBR5944044.1 amidohydrolase [Lachnospiraceae bacterium]
MGVLLKDILAVLPNGDDVEVKETSIYISDDRIAGIGSEPAGFKCDEVIEGKGKLVIPGLINCHTHSYMAFMRNVADDLPFMEWLFGRIDPIEQKMTDEDTYWGACLAIIEMLKTGTTCFNDMQMNPCQTSKAAIESGIRAVISRGLVGSGNDEGGRRRINETYKEQEFCKDCDRITIMMGPHAPYTCDDEYFRIVSDEAKKSNMGIHVHLSESVSEIEQIKEKYGCTPIEMAEKNGLFDVNCIAAHCVQVDDKDMDILKKHNVSVVTNPASNMKLGNGFAPVPEMMEKGINVCLGTDGAASNNSLNLFKELHLLTMIHKGTHKTPTCISAKEGFKIATINGAKALGLDKVTGSIEVGKKADLAILDLNKPSMQPVNNLIASLSYSADGTEVETVFVDGKKVVDKGRVTTLDEEKVYEKVNEIIKRLTIDIK